MNPCSRLICRARASASPLSRPCRITSTPNAEMRVSLGSATVSGSITDSFRTGAKQQVRPQCRGCRNRRQSTALPGPRRPRKSASKKLSSWGDAIILTVAFLLVVFRDLTEGIVVGFALGSLLFIA